MTRGLNKVMIIGHLGRDPEMRFTSSGRPVASFSVATTRGWTNNDGERQEETEWFHVVAWGGLAELSKKRLHKGSQVYAEGRLQTRCWESPEGERHYRTELVAQELIFLDSNDGVGDLDYEEDFDASETLEA
ncbi:MAG: single-stranded DNA-binding protein [Anaerolineae bacterium]